MQHRSHISSTLSLFSILRCTPLTMMDATTDLLSSSGSVPPSSFGTATMVDMPSTHDDVTSNDGRAAATNAAAASSSTSATELNAPSAAPNTNASTSNNFSNPWSAMMGGIGSLANSARGGGKESEMNGSNAVATSTSPTNSSNNSSNKSNKPSNSAPSSGNTFFFSNLTSNITSSVQTTLNNTSAISQPLSSFTKSISRNITGVNTLPDKTTASQVLMFRQLLHTKCRPGLRLSRTYEGTPAQMAVLHMPWWERGIEQSKKMIISYDNLITRLWLSGAIMPFEKGGYASLSPTGNNKRTGSIDTLINERGLPPVPHNSWVDRLGFQQDDPVTDFRSGGVLSLAMLVHIVESCPAVHSRFVPKPKPEVDTATSPTSSSESNILTLEEIITDDASVLPFGITCINITDMLAKFLLFSKAVDKMDALLSAKPFWKMFIDPNSMLVLQEVSLDLLCDVCVEIGRERRVQRLIELEKGSAVDNVKDGNGMPGTQNGKVTVFDFSEIMERTEKRVGDEVLGAGPQNVEELRVIARRVKSKYLLRIQLKEKHSIPNTSNNSGPVSPLGRQVPPIPSKEAVKNVTNSVTNSVIGGVGGLVSMLKRGDRASPKGSTVDVNDESVDVIDFSAAGKNADEAMMQGGQEVEVNLDGTTTSPTDDLFGSTSAHVVDALAIASPTNADSTSTNNHEVVKEDVDELEKLSAELGELSVEAFDLLGDDFDVSNLQDVDHSEELLDAMDVKLDPMAAFTLDDDDLLS